MNVSGQAVKKAMKKYNVNGNGLVVLHDNMELDIGEVKLVCDTSFQGHNGLKSIGDCLGGQTDFKRIQIGIGRPGSSDQAIVSNFVL